MAISRQPIIFQKFSRWLWPSRHLVNECSFKPGQQVLLYGDVSVKLVKHVRKAVGANGKVLVIGRNKHLTRYRKLMHAKYQQQVVINPFFENLSDNFLHALLICHAKVDTEVVLPLAKLASSKLKSKGRLLVVANKTAAKKFIALGKQQDDFSLTSSSGLLEFQKVK